MWFLWDRCHVRAFRTEELSLQIWSGSWSGEGIELQVLLKSSPNRTFSPLPVTCSFLHSRKITVFWTISLELEVISKSSAMKMKLFTHFSYDVAFKLVDWKRRKKSWPKWTQEKDRGIEQMIFMTDWEFQSQQLKWWTWDHWKWK